MGFERYVYVLPALPAFNELRASYGAVAKRHSWFSVMLPAQAEHLLPLYDDKSLFVFFSLPPKFILAQTRKACATFVYTEPLSPVAAMSLDGQAYRQTFFDILPLLDGVFLHTPAMCAEMRLFAPGVEVALLPAGLDPEVMGSPDWDCDKTNDFVFYGSISGKRTWSLPLLSERLQSRLLVATDCYGHNLGHALNRSHASVYVAHADVTSFSTWRIWQSLATSVAIISEGDERGHVDAWPLIEGQHYIGLPRLTPDNVDAFVSALLAIPRKELRAMAERAQEIRPHFTAERCISDYLVPAGKHIMRRS